jgi:hypothetical protein
MGGWLAFIHPAVSCEGHTDDEIGDNIKGTIKMY